MNLDFITFMRMECLFSKFDILAAQAFGVCFLVLFCFILELVVQFLIDNDKIPHIYRTTAENKLTSIKQLSISIIRFSYLPIASNSIVIIDVTKANMELMLALGNIILFCIIMPLVFTYYTLKYAQPAVADIALRELQKRIRSQAQDFENNPGWDCF